jgi:Secretion system C-terminal sorting domain
MKKIYTISFYAFVTLMVNFGNAQVSKLNYLLEYNAKDSTYAVYIKIVEGTSVTAPQRAQFNSQISIVKPTNTALTIIESHMPIQGNNAMTSTNPPLKWVVSSDVLAPAIKPNVDFLAVTPTLSPTSFYNKLVPQDEVKLFSFKVTPLPANPLDVRFFDNTTDPKNYEPGMAGADFRNGFTLGGVLQDYAGNLPSRIINAQTTSTLSTVLDDVIIYPNPTSSTCMIKSSDPVQKYEVFDINGKNVLSGLTSFVDCTSIPSGLYFMTVWTSKGKYIKKVLRD